ncbi:hypothetical protein PoB_002703500 [Plakobranchus ocellatus]|uniref:Uncharacterized protein n=1 Tax=Plakobranchus ocellatus TaxID=259542 RepID=A0AAV3ZZA6_9GAST|nr:hypothetical protein PoB_002703500 [Plakobranchus ocellatus]
MDNRSAGKKIACFHHINKHRMANGCINTRELKSQHFEKGHLVMADNSNNSNCRPFVTQTEKKTIFIKICSFSDLLTTCEDVGWAGIWYNQTLQVLRTGELALLNTSLTKLDLNYRSHRYEYGLKKFLKHVNQTTMISKIDCDEADFITCIFWKTNLAFTVKMPNIEL